MDVRAENSVNTSESDFTQYSIRLDQDFGSRARMRLIYMTSDGEYDDTANTMIYEHYSPTDPRRYATYADPGSALTYDFSNMLNPAISFDFDPANPANWEVSEFRDRIRTAESEFDTLRFDFDYDLTDDMTLKFGYSNKEYGFDRFESRGDRSFSSADELDGTVDGVACGIGFEVDSSMGSVATRGTVDWFQPDAALFGTFRDSGCWPQAVRAGNTTEVIEDDDAYYLQLDFFGDIAGMGLRGNIGVREVTTHVSSTGFTEVEDDLLEVTVDNDYTDTLPAINLALDISDELIVRFGWAKVISRPDLGDLSPGGDVSIFGIPEVEYGNPFLEPYRADNLDVALEWYFAENSLLALAYFERDIESFPAEETVLLPFSETGLPESVLGAQRDDLIDEDFLVTRNFNGGGARLNGWEIQYQQQFDFLPGIWENTGVIANYTWVESKEDETGLVLVGQSDDSYNLTVYYDDDKFSTRLSYGYRGEYNTRNSGNLNAVRYRAETGNLDFSASYQVNDNFRVTLEGLNLTDESQIDWLSPNVGGRLIEEQFNGRQWFIGVSYAL
jgi:TonB-dependent receptor